jgi:hypothetical protein
MARASDMTLNYRGLSVMFRHNLSRYKTSSYNIQLRVRNRMREAINDWADLAVALARIYCPIYEGDLENSIVKSEEDLYRGASASGRMKIQVGVLASWKSEYDETNPPWGESSPQVLRILHEHWEELAGPQAMARAKAKEARTGGQVGSHFMLRAVEEATEEYKKFMKQFDPMPSRQSEELAKAAALAEMKSQTEQREKEYARIIGENITDDVPF